MRKSSRNSGNGGKAGPWPPGPERENQNVRPRWPPYTSLYARLANGKSVCKGLDEVLHFCIPSSECKTKRPGGSTGRGSREYYCVIGVSGATGTDQSSGVGLFGVAGESSVIRGIGLVNAEVHGYSRVGGLVGKHSGTISYSYATGNVTGSDDDVGGLVGENSGQVSDSYAAGAVSGGADVGELVGLHSGTISDSNATGSVTGRSNYVGGLVGEGGCRRRSISPRTAAPAGAVMATVTADDYRISGDNQEIIRGCDQCGASLQLSRSLRSSSSCSSRTRASALSRAACSASKLRR